MKTALKTHNIIAGAGAHLGEALNRTRRSKALFSMMNHFLQIKARE